MNTRRGQVLFGGIPRTACGRRAFLTSIGIHAAGLGLVLLAAPQIIVQSGALYRFSGTLTAPPEPSPVRERARPQARPQARALVRVPALPQRPLPPIPARRRIAAPRLEEAPLLPRAPRLDAPLPIPAAAPAITPPVQMGLFASNSLPRSSPVLSVPQTESTSFDREAIEASAAPHAFAPTRPAGFSAASTEFRAATAAAAVHTGAFGQAPGGDAQTTKKPTAKIGGTGFDVPPAGARPAPPDPAVRSSGFEEIKAGSAPARLQALAPAIRPVEILDKPKPAYTAEARERKIEGTVLLDVVFTASGEVRVLRVLRGLGYGLDENAMEAARRIRYSPATQSGSPVDQRVTVHVVFEITS